MALSDSEFSIPLFSSDEETDHEPRIILTAVSDGSSSDEGTEPAIVVVNLTTAAKQIWNP